MGRPGTPAPARLRGHSGRGRSVYRRSSRLRYLLRWSVVIAGTAGVTYAAVATWESIGSGAYRNHLPAGHQSHPTTVATDRPARFTGPFAVGTQSMVVTEPGVGADSSGGVGSGGTTPRVITTYIRYPSRSGSAGSEVPSALPDTSDGPYPLVVFSQGFDISAARYALMLDAWSDAGFVVAAPVYPGTDPADPAGVNRADLVNHPADLRFVISYLLAQSKVASSVLDGLIDSSEIVVAGQSDGGDVSLSVTADNCCRDARIRAAMILSGAEYAGFGGSYFTSASVPMLLVQGTADTVNPEICSNQIYDAQPPPEYYLRLLGADHLSPYSSSSAYARIVDNVTVDFLNGITGRDAGALARVPTDGTVPGLATFTGTGPAIPLAGVCPDAPPYG